MRYKTLSLFALVGCLVFSSQSLTAYRPVPDASLARQLQKAQGEPYRVTGRVWLAADRQNEREAFAQFKRLGGALFLGPTIGKAEAHGTLQVDMASWKSQNERQDGPVKRHLLQVASHPFATLQIYDINGIQSRPPAIGKKGRGHLKAQLSMMGSKHWLDLPVRIYRFDENLFGIEPASPIHLTVDELGLLPAVRAFNKRESGDLPERVKCMIRLEVERVR